MHPKSLKFGLGWTILSCLGGCKTYSEVSAFFVSQGHMRCPNCQSVETKVIDSRMIDEGHTIRRRRLCEHCDHRFTTFEKKSYTELMVYKKDGRTELYDRDKIKKAISIAFGKRKVGDDTIDNVINKLEIKRSKQKNGLTSTRIGEDIVASLKEIDPVAYVRFASVYLEFDDYTDFAHIITGQEETEEG